MRNLTTHEKMLLQDLLTLSKRENEKTLRNTELSKELKEDLDYDVKLAKDLLNKLSEMELIVILPPLAFITNK